jgi:hypothetical protein
VLGDAFIVLKAVQPPAEASGAVGVVAESLIMYPARGLADAFDALKATVTVLVGVYAVLPPEPVTVGLLMLGAAVSPKIDP